MLSAGQLRVSPRARICPPAWAGLQEVERKTGGGGGGGGPVGVLGPPMGSRLPLRAVSAWKLVQGQPRLGQVPALVLDVPR